MNQGLGHDPSFHISLASWSLEEPTTNSSRRQRPASLDSIFIVRTTKVVPKIDVAARASFLRACRRRSGLDRARILGEVAGSCRTRARSHRDPCADMDGDRNSALMGIQAALGVSPSLEVPAGGAPAPAVTRTTRLRCRPSCGRRPANLLVSRSPAIGRPAACRRAAHPPAAAHPSACWRRSARRSARG